MKMENGGEYNVMFSPADGNRSFLQEKSTKRVCFCVYIFVVFVTICRAHVIALLGELGGNSDLLLHYTLQRLG